MNKHIALILSIMALFLIALSPAGWSASSSSRPAQLMVISQYTGIDAPDKTTTRAWLIKFSESAGAWSADFFTRGSRSPEPVCHISVDPARNGGTIDWSGLRRNRTKTGTHGFLVVPGYPAPCDVLPLTEEDQGRVYEDRASAGGQTFLRRYRVSHRPVTSAEAHTEGWLREDTKVDSGLRMVTVVDDQDRLVVRQLWPENGSWWVYEETPFRKSWVMR